VSAATLVRQVRLVPVGQGSVTGQPVPDGPVDLRIVEGRIAEVAPVIRPRGDDLVLAGGGRWAVPGLWDQHVHLTTWARSRVILDVGDASSPEEVARRVRDHVARLPVERRGTLVTGYGFRSATWAEQPTVALLDSVAGDYPVVLMSGDAHNGWLSSRALELLGQPPATGPLEENEWFALQPAITALTVTDDDALLRDAVADAATRGVVGLVDLEMEAGARAWSARAAAGVDTLRVRVGTYPDGLDDVVAAGLRTGDPLVEGCPLVTVGPLKVISDGSLNTRTAHCCDPYVEAAVPESPRGRQNYSPDELAHLLRRAAANGLEGAVHAIGDAALAIALDAFAATGARGSVEHVQLVRREDLGRLARLGLRASVQPAHLLDDRTVTMRLWADRTDRCFPFRSLLDAGTTLVLGSDAPVARLDPWLAMAAAVHRGVPEEEPWNPAEALTTREALAASTDGQPTLAVGGRGDVVLLDADPLGPRVDTAATARHLRGMPVAATLVAGRPVHLAL
jgi:predicted amidohydrolase YtcJ